MKTNPFDDAIRRKLESIDPPYREKDWVYMQSYMHQHGFPPAWTSWHGVSQWLLPVTSALTVASLLVVTFWQYHTNQQLQQSVQQLTQTVNRLAKNQPLPGPSTHQTDTVYVTYSTPPSPTTHASNQFPQTGHAPGERLATSPDGPPVGPDVVYPSAGTPANRQLAESNANLMGKRRATELAQTTDFSRIRREAPISRSSPGVGADAGPLADPLDRTGSTVGNGHSAPDRLAADSRFSEAEPKRPGRRFPSDRTGRTVSDQLTQPIRIGSTQDRSNERTERLNRSPWSPVHADNQRAEAATELQTERTFATPEALASLPLRFDTAYYPEKMARRARTIRSLLPRTPVAAKALEQKVAKQLVSTGVVRVGLNGEAGTKQRGVGLYADVIVNKHWSLGIGLDQVRVLSGRFITDYQFYARTHHDFRQEYAKELDHRWPILDINRRSTTWQLPITVGYRIALGQGFTLVPSAGVSLSLSAREQTTFSYQRTPKDMQQGTVYRPRPADGYTTWTLGVGAEKQWQHWVLQAGPTLINPLTPTPDQVNSTSLGVRTRLLYQF